MWRTASFFHSGWSWEKICDEKVKLNIGLVGSSSLLVVLDLVSSSLWEVLSCFTLGSFISVCIQNRDLLESAEEAWDEPLSPDESGGWWSQASTRKLKISARLLLSLPSCPSLCLTAVSFLHSILSFFWMLLLLSHIFSLLPTICLRHLLLFFVSFSSRDRFISPAFHPPSFSFSAPVQVVLPFLCLVRLPSSLFGPPACRLASFILLFVHIFSQCSSDLAVSNFSISSRLSAAVWSWTLVIVGFPRFVFFHCAPVSV